MELSANNTHSLVTFESEGMQCFPIATKVKNGEGEEEGWTLLAIRAQHAGGGGGSVDDPALWRVLRIELVENRGQICGMPNKVLLALAESLGGSVETLHELDPKTIGQAVRGGRNPAEGSDIDTTDMGPWWDLLAIALDRDTVEDYDDELIDGKAVSVRSPKFLLGGPALAASMQERKKAGEETVDGPMGIDEETGERQ